MDRPENDGSVRFLYGTALGRVLLKGIQGLHLDRLAVWYLRSPLSRPYMVRYARKNGIDLPPADRKKYRTYRDFFLRERAPRPMDETAGHLISPCDGFLSVYEIRPDSSLTAGVRAPTTISRAGSTASSLSPVKPIPSSP